MKYKQILIYHNKMIQKVLYFVQGLNQDIININKVYNKIDASYIEVYILKCLKNILTL